MNKVTIIKIAGFLVVPIIVMLITIYLLYPMINSDKYDLIVATKGNLNDSTLVDSLIKTDTLFADAVLVIQTDSLITDSLVPDSDIDFPEDENFAAEAEFWRHHVDSLQRLIYTLNSRIEGLENKDEQNDVLAKMEQEAFKDRVKSLLNLDEDELSPILDKMTSKQLVRLYSEAGNTQREKILRSLNSDRAARLITEIML